MSKILRLNERVAITYSIEIPLRKKGGDWKIVPQTRNLVTTRRASRATVLADIVDAIALIEDSPTEVKASFKSSPSYKVESFVPIKAAHQNKAGIKMKGVTMDLDGELSNSWDMRSGTCVFDWLRHRYGDKKGCIKIVRTLDDLWPTGRENGVSTEDLRLFAEKAGIYMYALDEDDAFIKVHKPKVVSHSLPALCFRVKNKHMYPIIDGRVSSYANRWQKMESGSTRKVERKETTTPIIKEIITLNANGGNREAMMVQTMRDLGTEVFPARNIHCSKDESITSFMLKDKLYVFGNDKQMKLARNVYEANDRLWKGESIIALIGEVMNKNRLELKGPINSRLLESLTHPTVKNRAHYGWISDTQEGDWAFDINRCYGFIIQNPLEPWMWMQLQDDWKPYVWAETLPLGLYFVETDDMTLFHGTNMYSAAMVMKARAEGIAHTVRSQCLASATRPKDLFAGAVRDIKELCHGNEKWEKALVNAMIGTLGQDKYTNRKVRLSTDQDTVFNDMVSTMNCKEFMTKHDNLYVYGSTRTTKMMDTAIPMWIQVLDQSNIRLYNLIKKSGGICIGRKTDCAVMRGGFLEFGTSIGDPRSDTVPEMTKMKERAAPLTIAEPTLWNQLPLFSSNQAPEIYQAMIKNGGILVRGRAGTGKTHVGEYSVKQYPEDFPGAVVITTAHTNKAANNIAGETIHKWLHINNDGKIDLKYLKVLQGKPVLVWVDEISVISGDIWNHLRIVKSQLPHAIFLLSGDERQCPPVEEIKVDWFNSDIVRSIVNNVQVELTERQRYDVDLWDLAEDVYENNYLGIKPNIYPVTEYSRHQNICYLNETRIIINKTANDYMRTQHLVRKEMGDRCVYVGLPVIADTTSKGMYANNESFTVTGIGTSLSLISIRRGKEHHIKITEEEFLTNFSLAYCITTHKLQGDTIDAPVYIWDSKRMNRNILYTAVTRVRRMDQIHITYGIPDLHA